MEFRVLAQENTAKCTQTNVNTEEQMMLEAKQAEDQRQSMMVPHNSIDLDSRASNAVSSKQTGYISISIDLYNVPNQVRAMVLKECQKEDESANLVEDQINLKVSEEKADNMVKKIDSILKYTEPQGQQQVRSIGNNQLYALSELRQKISSFKEESQNIAAISRSVGASTYDSNLYDSSSESSSESSCDHLESCRYNFCTQSQLSKQYQTEVKYVVNLESFPTDSATKLCAIINQQLVGKATAQPIGVGVVVNTTSGCSESVLKKLANFRINKQKLGSYIKEVAVDRIALEDISRKQVEPDEDETETPAMTLDPRIPIYPACQKTSQRQSDEKINTRSAQSQTGEAPELGFSKLKFMEFRVLAQENTAKCTQTNVNTEEQMMLEAKQAEDQRQSMMVPHNSIDLDSRASNAVSSKQTGYISISIDLYNVPNQVRAMVLKECQKEDESANLVEDQINLKVSEEKADNMVKKIDSILKYTEPQGQQQVRSIGNNQLYALSELRQKISSFKEESQNIAAISRSVGASTYDSNLYDSSSESSSESSCDHLESCRYNFCTQSQLSKQYQTEVKYVVNLESFPTDSATKLCAIINQQLVGKATAQPIGVGVVVNTTSGCSESVLKKLANFRINKQKLGSYIKEVAVDRIALEDISRKQVEPDEDETETPAMTLDQRIPIYPACQKTSQRQSDEKINTRSAQSQTGEAPDLGFSKLKFMEFRVLAQENTAKCTQTNVNTEEQMMLEAKQAEDQRQSMMVPHNSIDLDSRASNAVSSKQTGYISISIDLYNVPNQVRAMVLKECQKEDESANLVEDQINLKVSEEKAYDIILKILQLIEQLERQYQEEITNPESPCQFISIYQAIRTIS
ncbi:Hypothetical_protein [Hexamita inflata]|uniref:Hypothetical_protein n=1 Tax=Hexamita inflata TaxID=28002 RepID=A0AA86UNA8_9EUKA|nr:Hypothetical protein HINF_LOCUS52755 [Hexamita inflata]